MTVEQAGFRYTSSFRAALPAAAQPWTGLARYNFATGHNDRGHVPVEALAAAASTVIRRHGPELAMYNQGQDPLGFKGLRDFVADKLNRLRGAACSADDILITSGSLQGIDLINELLLEPGDTVIFEEFTYSAMFARAQRLGVQPVAVPLDDDGMQVDRLGDILERLKRQGTRPKYIYTIPTIQNPTGSILGLERRQKLLEVARAYAVTIFEDECYADIIWRDGAPPALWALDPEQVIHIGSFSKSLAPALRVGYVAAGWPVLAAMLACKNDGGTAALDQMVVAEYFQTHFDAHLRELSTALEDKLRTLIDALQREFGTAVELTVPKGGLFVWLRFPDHIDVRALVAPAKAAGVTFNPGPGLACDPEAATSYMRLCYGLPTREEIDAGITALARVFFEETGIPERGGNRVRQAT
ncbi:MAG: PLP-dependent aminotransferase family protein [Geminicoccaceae bacterium]